MPLILNDLWSKILWRTTESVRLDRVIVFIAEAFCETKIHQFDVTVLVQQEVFRLEISVCNAPLVLVEIFQDEHNLGCVEAGGGFLKTTELSEVAEELAPGDVIEEHVKAIMVGERGKEAGDEGVACYIGQDRSLVTDMLDLLQSDDFGLA